MKILGKIFLFGFIFILCCASCTYALNIPSPRARVNDYADMLNAQEEGMLEKRLEEYDKSTSNQISILAIKSLEGEVLEDFSEKVATKWGIGQKGKDNGILILISKAEHKMRIEVGYGLEGAIPDGVCGRIIREEVAPSFKKDKFYEGINNAIDKIELAAKGEYTAEQEGKGESAAELFLFLGAFLMLFSGMCGFMHFLVGGIIGAVGTFFLTRWIFNPGSFILFLATAAGFLVGMAARFSLEASLALSGGGSGSSFGGGGGDSGGGFGGFGGGGFGGGGASGSW